MSKSIFIVDVVVVVHPRLTPGVVGRVNIDAIHLALKFGQQAFQRLQVVAMNDSVSG